MNIPLNSCVGVIAVAALGMSSCSDKEASAKLTAATRDLTQVRSDLLIAQRRINQLERDLSESNQMRGEQHSRIAELMEQIDIKNRTSEGLIRELDAAQRKAERVSNVGVSAPRPSSASSTYAIPNVPLESVQIPWWIPPSQNTASRDIKAAALAEWKDDYRMVEYEIRKQTEALEALTALNKTHLKPIKDIIAKAVQEYGKDYSMIHYEAKRQIESLQKLQGR